MVSDKVLAEEWLEELAEGLSVARFYAENEQVGASSESIEERKKKYERARARLRLMSKLYAALCTEDGE